MMLMMINLILDPAVVLDQMMIVLIKLELVTDQMLIMLMMIKLVFDLMIINHGLGILSCESRLIDDDDG